MGFGEFGNNGSVHWRITHTPDDRRDKGFVHGRDPNPSKLSKFELGVRFRTRDSAIEALRTLQDAIADSKNEVRVTFSIPTFERTKETNNPPWEIQVRWSARRQRRRR